MERRITGILFALCMALFCMMPAAVAAAESKTINDADTLKKAFSEGGTWKVESDITVESNADEAALLLDRKQLILDLNGRTITVNATWPVQVDGSLAALTIKDSVGTGALKSQTSSQNLISVMKGTLTLESGSLISEKGYGIVPFNGGKVRVSGGRIQADLIGISGNATTDKTSPAYGSNTDIQISGGEIYGDRYGIYHPQTGGKLTISGGQITGRRTGVEVRAGEAIVTSGTITGLHSSTWGQPAENGTSSFGAGIALVQHVNGAFLSLRVRSSVILLYTRQISRKTAMKPRRRSALNLPEASTRDQ
ncbi:hypothetical protein [Hornefia butyriciproducens]|uniref:hypothetical protein n=1 Tax=Hornefia butyriciproducens TaxID=2652293 RepID=UPI002A91BE10|nr:hypothetical protein [Hornefia butyriciproducens]MDY5463086.1 hypothetical protein [Hornefia butyriciproducens]